MDQSTTSLTCTQSGSGTIAWYILTTGGTDGTAQATGVFTNVPVDIANPGPYTCKVSEDGTTYSAASAQLTLTGMWPIV